MLAKIKATGEIIEIYRVWGNKYQDSDKRSYTEDELEFDNLPNKIKREFWVARDADGYIYLFDCEPQWDNYTESFYFATGDGLYLGWTETFPDIKPGEKRKVQNTIAF